MFDEIEHRKLATWVNRNSKRLNDRLASARSREELRLLLADAKVYCDQLCSEREIHVMALAGIHERLEPGHSGQPGGTAPTETEAELRQDAELRQQVIAEFDRHIDACNAFLVWVQQKSDSLPAAAVDSTPEAHGGTSVLASFRGRKKWHALWAGLAALGLVMVILAVVAVATRPSSAPAPAPTVAPAVLTTATEPATLLPAAAAPTAAVERAATLEPAANPEPTATSEPEATSEPTAIPTAAPAAADNANLRSGPGTNYPIVDTVRAGQNLDIVERTAAGDWYRLRSDAWIAAFLVTNPPSEVPVATNIPAPPAPTPLPPAPTSPPPAPTLPPTTTP